MRNFTKAFTLIEMMISITILSIMMLYLYKTNATLHLSNDNLKEESHNVQKLQKIKQVIYLDFLSAVHDGNSSIIVINREKNEDFVSFMSKHSIHQRVNPYLTYIVKNKKLYRLESLKQIKDFEISTEEEFELDSLGDVEIFRLYKSKENKKNEYLLHIKFNDQQKVILKINSL